MRYPLQLVSTTEAFGPDVRLGIQLLPEPPEPVLEVPDCPDCPECPDCPPACVVLCKGWAYLSENFASTFGAPGFAANTGLTPILLGMANTGSQGSGIGLFPVGEFCGHRIRINVTTAISGALYTLTHIYDSAFSTHSEVMAYISGATSLTSGTFSVQAQIDLTDAAPGSETWTNICSPVTVTVSGGR